MFPDDWYPSWATTGLSPDDLGKTAEESSSAPSTQVRDLELTPGFHLASTAIRAVNHQNETWISLSNSYFQIIFFFLI